MSPAMLYLVISFTFIWVGFTLWKEGKNKIRRSSERALPWERTTAVVTGISSQFIGKGRSYCPMYRYTYGGREYRWTASIGVGEGTHKIGDIIEILVNPLNPLESELAVDIKLGSHTLAVADFFVGKSTEGIVFLLMSLVAFAAGAVCAVLTLKNWP